MRGIVRAVAEVLGWWIALLTLWIMLISTVGTLELAVGSAAALAAACAARAARRAAGR
ncbi:hypothetical protein [Streptomyces morookaense]|uniref:Uncharacterized protein n=1 Tax=Streptomyces morookaense TaxID=1970 RepID=A0A7Y7B0E5_STRMO|nr:hypothetical protein [Streptomyces morookaense]NVK76509.1 hypothetical protein [Streptomyces morookaense]GHF07625.1 hypothetical protein GCM10010359_05940 [Streptomyces morookaense]